MPDISFSCALINCMNANIFGFAACCAPSVTVGVTCAPQRLGQTQSSYQGNVKIMKGALPTFSELTTNISRDADLLMSFSSFYLIPVTSTVNTNPITVTSLPTIATGTGVATWFWIQQGTQWAQQGCAQFNRAWGTVGLQGSGADLEISDTNVVANNAYKIINLRMGIPQTYTY